MSSIPHYFRDLFQDLPICSGYIFFYGQQTCFGRAKRNSATTRCDIAVAAVSSDRIMQTVQRDATNGSIVWRGSGGKRPWRAPACTEWITAAKVGEMPPRPAPAPLTFTFQSGATDGGAAARAPLARRPRSLRRRRADTPTRIVNLWLCPDYSEHAVLRSTPWIQLLEVLVKVEPLGNPPITVVQLARGTRARPRTLPEEACRKRGSGASARKPQRALLRTLTPWIALAIPDSHLKLSLGKNRFELILL